jgi:hypothetical protein
MMRMTLIVVGLSTLTIMELSTPSRTKTSAPDPFDQLMIDGSVSPDTLETADRLETHHLPHLLQPPPAIPTMPPDSAALVPREPGTVGLGSIDKKDVVGKQKPKLKYATDPDNPLPKRTSSRQAAMIERSKARAIVEVRSCRQKAFDSLLQALKLPSQC